MQNWVLHAPRLTVLSANKEGIISLPGYIALFLLGIDTGLYILPSHPFWAYRSVNTRGPPSNEPQHLSTLYVMLALSAAWWGTLLFIQSFFDAAVSRVLVSQSLLDANLYPLTDQRRLTRCIFAGSAPLTPFFLLYISASSLSAQKI